MKNSDRIDISLFFRKGHENMVESWLLELLKGLGKLFLHPVLYFSFFFAIFAGYIRVKRERKDFKVRTDPGLHELKKLIPIGILAGTILSILSIFIGLTIPLEVIVIIAISTILLAMIGHARLLSAAITIGLPLVILGAASIGNWSIPYINEHINLNYLIMACILMALLTLTEGILMLKNGLINISPKLRLSKRGLSVGALQTKRLWLIPFLLFIPSGTLPPLFDWWPVIPIGSETYSIIIVPFLIGFQQQIQGTLPYIAIQTIARQTILLGVLLLLLSIAAVYYPAYIPTATALVAVAGRLWIAYRHRVRENKAYYYFTPRNNGVMVLDVLPGSPAEKMGLKTGEIIQTCNQIPIKNKQELYEALQINRAYCKLEVLDINQEIRFVQRALYENDHHELGILFIENRNRLSSNQAG